MPSWYKRTALRQPPHTQPVSSDNTSERCSQPSVDQWPNATVVAPAVLRPGTSNQGTKPGGAAAAPSLVSNSIRSSAVQKRRRVSTFTITRRRVPPRSSLLHWSGLSPYICARKSPSRGPRNTSSTSRASATAWVAVQDGNTPACTISTSRPCMFSSIAIGCERSQSSSTEQSGASSTADKVSLRRGAGRPCASASKCRSWLPSTLRAAGPKVIRRRSTASESGPRLTRSPSRNTVSRLGEKSMASSRRCSASSQPCISPIM